MTTAQAGIGSTTYAIRAVDRVCDILDTLANGASGVSLSEVAEAAGLPKSSAFRYLAALEMRRYVEREADGSTYRLGLAFRPQHTRGVERLAELARPVLEKLRDELKETTNLGILDGDQVVHILVAESPYMMRLAARAGERGYVHCTALGKAMCAKLAAGRVQTILAAAGMPRFTEATLTEPDKFLAELDRTRVQGFGIDEAENQPAGRCIAVAIENIHFPAGVSVSAPLDRLPNDRIPHIVEQLQLVAHVLAREMHA